MLISISGHQYQLVVVCTSENEFNARIAASLERYSRPAPITAADADKMLDYLRCKFTVPEEESLSAARVDPERFVSSYPGGLLSHRQAKCMSGICFDNFDSIYAGRLLSLTTVRDHRVMFGVMVKLAHLLS